MPLLKGMEIMERSGRKHFVRLCTLLLAVALLCAFSIAALAAENGTDNEPVCYTHGDVNGDGIIDNRDAIYTLYHFVYGDEKYPVEQDWDFNGDGEYSNKDAIYVLYASLFEEDPDYQLKGLVHSYYDPAWEWSEEDGQVTAQVEFKCGCGEDHVFSTEEGSVTVVSSVKEEATCLKSGTLEYVASVEFDGQKYTNTKTEPIPVLKHDMDGFQTCEDGAKCNNCDYELPALGHNWEVKSRTEASCTSRAVITYQCTTCFSSRNEATGEFADHVMKYMDGCDVAEGCKYTQQYKCENCPLTTDGTVYYKHNYVAQIVPATCVADGSKTYVCDKCHEPETDEEGNVKTEVLHDANAHNWIETAEGSGIFNCTNAGCDASKKTVDAANKAVDVAELNDIDEMQLNDGAAMAVDSDTLEKLNVQQTIQVTVTPVAAAESGLSAEQQAQIPGDTVYNFEMKVDGEKVAEFGTEITISLPYTPEEGEDLDAIDVWYVADDGTVKSYKGVYSNGFVTFTTTHFSYYTVTRMTAAERCARYGHIWVSTHKEPTCTEDGYDLVQCQRCGEKDSDKKLEKTGHDYKETVKAATCTEEGSITKLCQHEDCKSYLIENIPALGHKMEKNTDLSKAATCEAPGKEVHTCTRENCDKKTEIVLAQRTHSYKLHEQKQPDCVNKGYRQIKCEYEDCGHIVTDQEKAPLGHEYLPENAVWNWSDDKQSATVTLVCTHDKTHTKELTAVVSTVVKAESSCLGSGAVTYTATASFNKAEFSNSVTVTQAAAGHKPDSSWSKDDTNHWHVCSACEDKVDVAFHSWDEGKVVTAPTCADAGETLYTCTVCAQQKTVAVKATGAHDYHYGICRNCGFGQSTCTHEAIHAIEADMSEYGLCEGAVFYWVTCDCGQNKTLTAEALGCDLAESEIRVETDAYGQKYEVYVVACPDCGLVGEEYSYRIVDEDTCTAVWAENLRIVKDGQTLIDTQYVIEQEVYQHPTVVTARETDLSQYGLCGLTVVECTCPCGDQAGVKMYVANGCNFQYDPALEAEVCTGCGARLVTDADYRHEEGTCLYEYDYLLEIYDADGGKLFDCEWTSRDYYHNEELVEYQLAGTSCEDGLQITMRCVDCGSTETRNLHYHATVITKKTDLSGYDICQDTLVQAACPCGARKDSWLTSTDDGSYCQWEYYDLDGVGEPEYRVCINCGATNNVTVSYGEKNEWCDCLAYATDTYRDKDGNRIAVGYRVYDSQNHDMEKTATLMGENCEEGVLIVEQCKDCDYGYEWEEHWHYTMPKATFDLSALDMCATKGVLESCLCGEQEYFSWSGGHCQWQWVDGFDGGNIEQCSVCGIVKKESYRTGKSSDLCHILRYVTLEFSRDGVLLGKFSFEQMSTNHFYVAELEMIDEAAGCAGGVRGTATCIVCGDETEFESFGSDNHPTFATEMEIICQEDLCGTLVKVKAQCACGEESWENEQWHGDNCRFESERYDETLDQWVQICSQCGAERTTDREQTRVEGTTCTVQAVEHVTFYKNGEVLCQYDSVYTYDEHTYIADFELLGATCDEGYYVTRVCAFCGESYRSDDVYYGCQEYLVDIVTVCDDEDICGPVYARQISCACGRNVNAYVTTYGCEFEWVGQDHETGEVTHRCRICGMEEVGTERVETTLGSCDAKKTLDYTYSLNGQILSSITRSYDVKEHDMRYSFTLLGESCDDGYYMSEQCVNCSYGYSSEDLRMGHEWFILERYDLSQYGMCGGDVSIEGCPCGKERNCYEYVPCNWRSTGNTDPDTGLEERYCADCDTYYYAGTVGQTSKTDCRFTGEFIFKAVRGGQLLLEVRAPAVEYRHTYQLVGANFDSEDHNCASGVELLIQCAVCGNASQYHTYYHETFAESYIDLAEAGFACGGELRSGSCACGEDKFLHWGVKCSNMTRQDSTSTDADGDTHSQSIYECPDCGLKLIKQWYSKQDEGCRYSYHETVEVYKNGQLIKTLNVERPEYHHTSEDFTYALAEGSQTCEDGLIMTWACKYCGETFSGHTTSHGMNQTDTAIDLTQYGSVCGGSLVLYQCPCGYAQEYRFSEDCKCDVTQYLDTLWISDAIDGDQPNADGHTWLYSYAHRVGCGVTDPTPCGLELMKAVYWTVEDCIATQYVTWRLGYDEATGTWDREITTTTGYQSPWHDYQDTESDQRVNGTGTYTWRYDCPDCGSYHEMVETWQNDHMQTRTEDTYNALSIGNNRRRYIVDESGYQVQSKVYPDESFWMPTESKHTYTRMNGDVFEEEWVHTYDFSGNCKRTTTYRNSYGEQRTETGSTSVLRSEWDVGTQATCTQYGEWVRPCRICGEIAESERMPMEPTMHNFQWDSGKEKYVCTVCELESVRGYSGSIAMEELSDANDADHIIGYWNRDDIEFMPTVSVMLYDVSAGEMDELVLTGIQFNYHTVENDGFTGLSFSKAAAQAAADQAIAEAGYSGSYGIRISFVPLNTQDELDYAITFDTQTTAE